MTKEQTALENAQQAAANLLGEIADDPDLMRAIGKEDPDLGRDIRKVAERWKAAGEAFLRSLHA